jgi:cytochrome c oxidase subunit 2
MYSEASNFVQGVDTAFIIILGVSIFFLVGITIVMLVFIHRYHKSRREKSAYIEGSNTLEAIWTIIPTILVLVMFWYGWKGFSPMRKPPKDALEITAVARMWSFSFDYGNGKVTDTLYVPLNKAVKLNLKSMDVIHSLYIPAFRVKEDMVPGREDNFMWFIAQKEGVYDLFCTEYCGLRHSYMYTAVVPMPEEEFFTWLGDTSMTSPGIKLDETMLATLPGKRILQTNGCIACHSLDGSKIVGPTFKGLYGKKEVVETNGIKRDIVVDDEYIKKSIYEPDFDITEGYNKGLMVSYKDQISEEEITDIIEFLKTLNE